MRRPRLHKALGGGNGAGLSNYLSGNADLDSLIQEILAKDAEIRRRIAETHEHKPARARPARADRVRKHSPRHDAERLRIEIAKIDDVEKHGWTSYAVQTCRDSLAQLAAE